MKLLRHFSLLLVLALPGRVDAQFQWMTNANNTITITNYHGTIPTNLVIPGTINGLTVTGIGDSSFAHYSLTSVSLPDSITSIGEWAFGYDTLTDVKLPHNLANIGNWAFGHNSLTNLSLPENVITVGDWAFAYNLLTNVTFSQRLTTIGDGTFASNDLVSVSLPASIASIGNDAFANNRFLTAIYCASNAPFVRDETFVTGASLTTVYYQPGMNGWWLTLGGSPTLLTPAPITVTRLAGSNFNLPFATLATNWNPALMTLQSITLTTGNGVKLATNKAMITYPADSPNVADEIIYTIANHDYPQTISSTGVIHVQVSSAQGR